MNDQPSPQLLKLIVNALDVFPPKFKFDKKDPNRRYAVSYSYANTHDVFVIQRMSSGHNTQPTSSLSTSRPPPPSPSGQTGSARSKPTAPPEHKGSPTSRGRTTTDSSKRPPGTAPSSTRPSPHHYRDGRPLTPGRSIPSSHTTTGPSHKRRSRTRSPPRIPVPSSSSTRNTSSTRPSSSSTKSAPPPIDQPILTPPSSSRSTATGSRRSRSPVKRATKRAKRGRSSQRSSVTSSSPSSRSSTPSPQAPPQLTTQQLVQLQELLNADTNRSEKLTLLHRLVERRDSDTTEELLENA